MDASKQRSLLQLLLQGLQLELRLFLGGHINGADNDHGLENVHRILQQPRQRLSCCKLGMHGNLIGTVGTFACSVRLRNFGRSIGDAGQVYTDTKAAEQCCCWTLHTALCL